MKPDISPMRPIWSAYSDFIKKGEDELSLRIKRPVIFTVVSIPLCMGVFLIYKSILMLLPLERPFYLIGTIFGIIFGVICLFIAYMVLQALFFDLTLFRKNERKVYIKRGKFSGSMDRVFNFSDIALFQVLEYRDPNKDYDHNSLVYELNMVMTDYQRVNLTYNNKMDVTKNARKISLFTNKSIKVIRD
jgi:hypothetical protein